MFASLGGLLVEEKVLFLEVGVSKGEVVEGPEKGSIKSFFLCREE